VTSPGGASGASPVRLAPGSESHGNLRRLGVSNVTDSAQTRYHSHLLAFRQKLLHEHYHERYHDFSGDSCLATLTAK
jgi:hypothetical protein